MISLRLNAIVDIVPECKKAADIGCDHGKVAVALVKKGKAKSVICTDISSKSLEKARKLAKTEELVGVVSFRQGDGLKVLKENEIDVVVIAGMGGELMTDILQNGKGSVPETLVLSCNSAAEILREWLSKNSFLIEDEELILEGGHYYPVILARQGQPQKLSDIELEFGPVILKKRPKVLKKFLKRKIETTREIRENLFKANKQNKDELVAKIDEQLERYSEVERCLQQ